VPDRRLRLGICLFGNVVHFLLDFAANLGHLFFGVNPVSQEVALVWSNGSRLRISLSSASLRYFC
jgi:hypothetical protein